MADVKASGAVARIGIRELEGRLGVDRSTISRWCRAEKFPEPHFVGERRAWFLGEIQAWEARRMVEQATRRRGARNLAGGDRAPAPSSRAS